ncbi:MAG: HNH endonuclease [Deltaproteobacteria bacterium]|nr:HNH endonuclease [Deltaproteobacteria bacterium]
MQHALNLADKIHEKAIDASTRYKKAEGELIEILQQAEQYKVFLEKGHASLFLYAVKELRLSESVAYNLIAISRKAREVPELKASVQAGAITISNAKRIVPVLNRDNQSEWIAKGCTLSQRQLEKEIARVRPEAATVERATYVTETRVKLEVGLSEKEMLRLRRVQDLLSQSRRCAISLEETLARLIGEFLSRHDPLERAKRRRVRKGFAPAAKPESKNPTDPLKTLVARQVRPGMREPIPAEVLHQVSLRDQRRCVFRKGNGERCSQSRWIEVHHKIPVGKGGENTLENLTTLCSAHHGWIHSRENETRTCDLQTATVIKTGTETGTATDPP